MASILVFPHELYDRSILVFLIFNIDNKNILPKKKYNMHQAMLSTFHEDNKKKLLASPPITFHNHISPSSR
jgi:hypothetical protein